MSTLIVLLASAGCVKRLVEEALSIHQVDVLCREAKIKPKIKHRNNQGDREYPPLDREKCPEYALVVELPHPEPLLNKAQNN